VTVPFNYDPWRDNKADLAVKNAAGDWYIDYAYNGLLDCILQSIS
jgi:hypothetical protein